MTPVAVVSDPVEQQRSRIVHVAVLALLPTLMVGVLLTQLAMDERVRFPLGFALASLLVPLFAAYRLSYTRHFPTAAWIMLSSLLVAAFAGMVVWGLEARPSAESSLWLVLFPVGLAGVVLESRAVLAFVVATLTGLYGITELVPEVSFAAALTPMGVVACLGALGVAGARLREESLATLDAWRRHADSLHSGFGSLLEALPVALCRIEYGQVAQANAAFAALFGVSASEAIGQPIDRFVMPQFPDSSEPRDPHTGTGLRAAGRRSDGSAMALEVFFLDPDDLTGAPSPQHVLVVLDRSDAVDAANRLAAARELDARSVLARQQLLDNLRRIIGEPLNSMDALCAELEHEVANPHQGAVIRGFQSNIGRLRTLGHKIHMLSDVRAGQVEVVQAAVGLRSLVERVCAAALQVRPEAEIAVVDMPAEPDLFDSDPLKFEQALKGIVFHALRSGLRVTVRVVLIPDTRMPVALEVTDSGTSLAVEQQAALRDPLRFEGGLDLALSAAIFEHLGHPVSIHGLNAVGGTTYRVSLSRPAS
jgi:signal transduction histidine kinase